MHGSGRLPAEGWADLLLDAGSAHEVAVPRDRPDPIGWPGYAERQAGMDEESVRLFTGRCGGAELVLIAFDFTVMGGSMGTEAGRRLRAGYDRAREVRVPVVLVTCTGGARMQEGMRSLVQMPGSMAAAVDHADAGLLQVGIAADPTTGGVYASVLTACDVVVAEPGAYVSFSGPRVAAALGDAATLARQGTGSAGELAIAGQVDAVVPREEMAGWLGRALAVAAPPVDPPGVSRSARVPGATRHTDRPVPPATPGVSPSAPAPCATRHTQGAEPFEGPAWDAVAATRDPDRPRAEAIIERLDGIVPLVGDRAGGVDVHTTVGLARLDGRRFVLVAQDHGPVEPAGFRTAIRGMALAERLGVPVVALVDTRGAAVGAAVDDAGQAGAMSAAIRCLLSLRTPVLSVVVGEGGSGGAIALAAADRLLVQRTATFSVIAPEGAAAILHRDARRAPEVAEHLALRSADLRRLGIADGVVADDADGTLAAIRRWLADPGKGDPARRRDRWRRIADGGHPDPPPPPDLPMPATPDSADRR